MTKNVIIALLTVITIFLAVFSTIKVNESEREKLKAEANLAIAEEHRIFAEAAELKAIEAAAKARVAERQAMECQAVLEEFHNK